ncbi:hypothetical protein ACJJTC_007540 [Scirpophaga incertulas]
MQKTEFLLTPEQGKCCFCCLTDNEDRILYKYSIRNECLKTIMQIDYMCLCYICYKMAQHAESFVQKVKNNQHLLQNRNAEDLSDSALNGQIQSIVNLKEYQLYLINIDNNQCESDEGKFSIVPNNIPVEVKIELKEEIQETFDNNDADCANDDDIGEIKDEDDYPLKDLLKSVVKIEGTNLKKKKMKKKLGRSKKEASNRRENNSKIKHIAISIDQCMQERVKMAEDSKYLDCLFKCTDCIKGFNFKSSFDKHMEKHSEKNGDYECDICKQRMSSEDKLQSHKRCHQVRYRCARMWYHQGQQADIRDHYKTAHCPEFAQFNCPHCPKVFFRQTSLRKHICYLHTKKERISCSYCDKTYANIQGLKTHIMVRHQKDEESKNRSKRHVCQECGMGFAAPSLLKNHSIKHSLTRDYYCVECDKSFKTEAVLKNHLKIAAPHVNYMELPLTCAQCDKRFAIRRDLERHMNRVHLNIRPYQCDKCDKAYVNGWSLGEHKRLVHEGYKRPLRFPCTMCDKVFDRKQILKGHIRTHTGEKPFQCSKCPAAFSQASILGTHVKLIHLKLTRDGRPKSMVMK